MNTELDAFFEGVQAHMKASPNSDLWDLLTRNARFTEWRESLDEDSCARLVSAAHVNGISLSQNEARRLISLEDSEAGRMGPPDVKNAAGEAPTLISLLMFRRQKPEGGLSKDFAALVRLDEDAPSLVTFSVIDRDIPRPAVMASVASTAYLNPNHLWVRDRVSVKYPGLVSCA